MKRMAGTMIDIAGQTVIRNTLFSNALQKQGVMMRQRNFIHIITRTTVMPVLLFLIVLFYFLQISINILSEKPNSAGLGEDLLLSLIKSTGI